MIKLILWIYKNIILSKKNVNGVGTGYRIKDGKITKDKCIIVGVKHKQPLEELKLEDVVPKSIMGVGVDVLDVGDIKLMWKKKHRPMKLGASACWEGLTACSFGLPLYTETDKYVLMNQHCTNPHGSKPGDALVNPSPVDQANDQINLKIGEINEIYFPVSHKRTDNIDLALPVLSTECEHRDVEGVSYIPETRKLTNRDLLKNIWGGGRTLGERRKGIIISIDFEATVRGIYNGNTVYIKFPDCVLSLNSDGENPIVRAGDSSSVRFVDDRPLLQTFAGSEVAAIFNQTARSIEWIEKEFGMKLYLEPQEKLEGYVALDRQFLDGEKTLVNLNLREKTGTRAKVIRVLSKGTKVEIIEYAVFKDGYHWVKVRI